MKKKLELLFDPEKLEADHEELKCEDFAISQEDLKKWAITLTSTKSILIAQFSNLFCKYTLHFKIKVFMTTKFRGIMNLDPIKTKPGLGYQEKKPGCEAL